MTTVSWWSAAPAPSTTWTPPRSTPPGSRRSMMPIRILSTLSCGSTLRSRAPRSAGKGSSTTRTWTAPSTWSWGCTGPASCSAGSPSWSCRSRPRPSTPSARNTWRSSSPGRLSVPAPPNPRPTGRWRPASPCRWALKTVPMATWAPPSMPCRRPPAPTPSWGSTSRARSRCCRPRATRMVTWSCAAASTPTTIRSMCRWRKRR